MRTKYIKVWKRSCVKSKHYEEITQENFLGIIETMADELCCEDGYEDEDGNICYKKYEHLLSYYIRDLREIVGSTDGLDCGDFYLYERPVDFNIYDLPIKDR